MSSQPPAPGCAASPMVYRTRISHRRTHPVRYRFEYRVFALLLDIDALGETCARSRWLSHNRLNLFSFHDRDHGARDGTAPRAWIDATLAAAGVRTACPNVRLLCFPRVFGYAFNPISVWYCSDAGGKLRAVVCEVSNTFGEQHCYLLQDRGEPVSWPARGVKRKCFHVSPLIGMEAEYHFRFSEPGNSLGYAIREYADGRLLLVAALSGRGEALDDRSLLRAFARTPLMSFKVTAAIHWQALKIFLRGAPFHRKPPPPRESVS